MNVSEIREMDDSAIHTEVENLERELMKMRLGNPVGITENPIRIRNTRRDIARMKTILRERALEIRQK